MKHTRFPVGCLYSEYTEASRKSLRPTRRSLPAMVVNVSFLKDIWEPSNINFLLNFVIPFSGYMFFKYGVTSYFLGRTCIFRTCWVKINVYRTAFCRLVLLTGTSDRCQPASCGPCKDLWVVLANLNHDGENIISVIIKGMTTGKMGVYKA